MSFDLMPILSYSSFNNLPLFQTSILCIVMFLAKTAGHTKHDKFIKDRLKQHLNWNKLMLTKTLKMW